jgi:hypothetical protein
MAEPNGNGTFDARLKSYLGWAAVVGALALQLGVITTQVAIIREDTKENVVLLRQLQLQAVERGIQMQSIERRMATLEARFELLAKAFVSLAPKAR